MTTDDRLLSGASSLNPNKSSGDIGERLRDIPHYLMILPTIGMPDQVTVGALAHEAAAEIERLRREVEEFKERAHYAEGTAELAMKHRDAAESRNGDLQLEVFETQEKLGALLQHAEKRALTAESAVAAAWEEAADWLAAQYPDNANTNAFCAALRSHVRSAV